MNLQTFITLLVVGSLVGLVTILTRKSAPSRLPLTLATTILGAFAGWFVLRQISGTAIMIGFAIGGSLTLLWLLQTIRK